MGCKLRRTRIDRKKKAEKANCDNIGLPDSSYDQRASSPGSCVELQPVSSSGQSPELPQALQFENKVFGHQNVGFEKEMEGKYRRGIVQEIGTTVC